VIDPLSPEPELEPLNRTQVLVAIGITAIVLLTIAKAWQYLGQVQTLSLVWSNFELLLGLGLGLGITLASGLLYFAWSRYRESTTFYLDLIVKPLLWTDLVWLGLLPGLSEELLFRGVMLPALGLGWLSVAVSSVCFGVLHLNGTDQWPYALWATVIGLLLGISALLTGHVLVAVVAHITTNLLWSGYWKWRSQTKS
jgi:membrane protease YdiL (CAAX protease family)